MNGYISEIRAVAFDTSTILPEGWLPCDGRTLLIRDYQALYSLIEKHYGWYGEKYFNLPDLRGRTHKCILDELPYHRYSGSEDISLTLDQMPSHTHKVVTSLKDNLQNGKDGFFASTNFNNYFSGDIDIIENNYMVSSAGGNIPHNNIQPSIGLNFLICFDGQYPKRH